MKPRKTQSGDTLHPLLVSPEESVHQLSAKGAAIVEEYPELAPGHDCCAVCAAECEAGVTCSSCDSVVYCSPQHLVDDAPHHAAVCQILKCIRRAEGIAASLEPKPCPSPKAGETERQEEAGPSGWDDFVPPQRGQDGWAYVAPEKFLRVYPSSHAERDDELARSQPASKRMRVASGEAATTPEAQPATDGGSPRRDEPQTDEADLQLAVELSERTAALTYAYTAAYALNKASGSPGGAAAGGGEGARQDPLRALVLGAAGDAELADLESWQVLTARLGRDVHLHFVGPEVPDELAGSTKQLGRLRLRFLQGTFDSLRIGGRGSGASKAGGSKRPAGNLIEQPDIIFAFNPGFTCPDYEWSDTLEALGRLAEGHALAAAGSPAGRPTARRPPYLELVVATNTRCEADMDTEMLRDHRWLPTGPVTPNPYSSLKALQNGVLANDLYRKNAWLTVYRHADEVQTARRKNGRRRNGRKGAGVKGAAQALYSKMVGPIVGLFKKKR